jgi:hypothetical protein
MIGQEDMVLLDTSPRIANRLKKGRPSLGPPGVDLWVALGLIGNARNPKPTGLNAGIEGLDAFRGTHVEMPILRG